MLRRMPEPCARVSATCQPPSAARLTMPRWYSVRPGFLRIGVVLAARSSGSGSGAANR
jgi:hypothetical protein